MLDPYASTFLSSYTGDDNRRASLRAEAFRVAPRLLLEVSVDHRRAGLRASRARNPLFCLRLRPLFRARPQNSNAMPRTAAFSCS